MTDYLGLGIAGNFAEHLTEAGEDKDFVNVTTADPNAPKGVFPFHVPNHSGVLGENPVCDAQLKMPSLDADAKLQAEPEMALQCRVTYKDGLVESISPIAASAFNDCSIRKPNAKKISEKKNWGACSKGLANDWVSIESFSKGSNLDDLILTSQVQRKGEWMDYGIASPVKNYGYFYGQLIQWLQNQVNTQEDTGPLENIREHLKTANYPETWIVALGATRYTEFGMNNPLQSGDVLRVALMDSKTNTPASALEQNVI